MTATLCPPCHPESTVILNAAKDPVPLVILSEAKDLYNEVIPCKNVKNVR